MKKGVIFFSLFCIGIGFFLIGVKAQSAVQILSPLETEYYDSWGEVDIKAQLSPSAGRELSAWILQIGVYDDVMREIRWEELAKGKPPQTGSQDLFLTTLNLQDLRDRNIYRLLLKLTVIDSFGEMTEHTIILKLNRFVRVKIVNDFNGKKVTSDRVSAQLVDSISQRRQKVRINCFGSPLDTSVCETDETTDLDDSILHLYDGDFYLAVEDEVGNLYVFLADLKKHPTAFLEFHTKDLFQLQGDFFSLFSAEGISLQHVVTDLGRFGEHIFIPRSIEDAKERKVFVSLLDDIKTPIPYIITSYEGMNADEQKMMFVHAASYPSYSDVLAPTPIKMKVAFSNQGISEKPYSLRVFDFYTPFIGVPLVFDYEEAVFRDLAPGVYTLFYQDPHEFPYLEQIFQVYLAQDMREYRSSSLEQVDFLQDLRLEIVAKEKILRGKVFEDSVLAWVVFAGEEGSTVTIIYPDGKKKTFSDFFWEWDSCKENQCPQGVYMVSWDLDGFLPDGGIHLTKKYQFDGKLFSPVGGFIRGDVNGDGRIDLSDAVFILSYLFLGGASPECEDATDVNDDGMIQISDPIALLGYLFQGSSAPPSPFLEKGSDPTDDNLAGEC